MKITKLPHISRKEFLTKTGASALALTVSGSLLGEAFAQTQSKTMKTQLIPTVSLHTVEADGVEIFYRESGPADAPVLLLLHGYPTSSHMFRDLFPRLASTYRLIASDLPGFGFTEVPAERNYHYSFDNLAVTTNGFVEALGLKRYAIYVFDYGAPTGFPPGPVSSRAGNGDYHSKRKRL